MTKYLPDELIGIRKLKTSRGRKYRWPRHKYPGMIYPKEKSQKKTWKVNYRYRQCKREDPLTIREKQVLYYIRTFQLKNRFSPKGTDIAFVFGVVQSTANYYIKRLVLKGFIELTPTNFQNYDPHRQILFPRNFQTWDWSDYEQFPHTVFPTSYHIWLAQRKAARDGKEIHPPPPEMPYKERRTDVPHHDDPPAPDVPPDPVNTS